MLRLARVMSFSARRWASLAFAYEVWIDSCLIRDVTRLRRRACRCAELRLKCRYLTRPPAIAAAVAAGLPAMCRAGAGAGEHVEELSDVSIWRYRRDAVECLQVFGCAIAGGCQGSNVHQLRRGGGEVLRTCSPVHSIGSIPCPRPAPREAASSMGRCAPSDFVTLHSPGIPGLMLF